jgi:hypothetical protein
MDGMTKGWDTGIQAMLHHQMTLSQGVRSAGKQMEDQFEKSVINMGLQWVKGMLLQEITGEKAHAAENLTTAKSSAGHAYDAVVGIPFVGPALAPAAAATAWAAVMAFAEQGYDVPAGVNPVTQLHAKEMVLPAHLSEGFRQMIAAGGAGGAGGGPNITIHNHGGIDAGAWFQQNQGALLKTLGTAVRNGRNS